MADCKLSTKVAYFCAGIGIGAVVALLFAPKSGEETRRMIAEKVGEGKDYLTEKGKEIGRQASDLVDRSKEAMNKQRERLADALESGVRTTFGRS